MKLNIAINALAASVSTFAASASASGAVAKDPRDDRAEEGSIRAAASKNQGAECSFAVGIEVKNSPDVGVLSCHAGEMCVEDSMSSIGGRCVVSGDEVAHLGFHLTFDLPAYAQKYGCKACDEEGKIFKCCGSKACEGLNEDEIPCGSCNGWQACLGSRGRIGKYSCNGSSMPCNNCEVNVGDGSCNDADACLEAWSSNGDIGDNTCNFYHECFMYNRPGLTSIKK